MRRHAIFVFLLSLSIVFAWLIISLIAHFSPVQLTPEDYTYIISPPSTDMVSDPQKVAKASIDYAGFITILLGLISALLAALGLGIAVLAVIGWNSITGKVELTATNVIRSSISDGEIKTFIKTALSEGGPLHDAVRNEARYAMYNGVESIVNTEDINRELKNDS